MSSMKMSRRRQLRSAICASYSASYYLPIISIELVTSSAVIRCYIFKSIPAVEPVTWHPQITWMWGFPLFAPLSYLLFWPNFKLVAAQHRCLRFVRRCLCTLLSRGFRPHTALIYCIVVYVCKAHWIVNSEHSMFLLGSLSAVLADQSSRAHPSGTFLEQSVSCFVDVCPRWM